MTVQGKVTLDQLLGMRAVQQQLDLKYHNAIQYSVGAPSYYTEEHLRGYHEALHDVTHLLNEVTSSIYYTDRETWTAYEEAIKGGC